MAGDVVDMGFHDAALPLTSAHLGSGICEAGGWVKGRLVVMWLVPIVRDWWIVDSDSRGLEHLLYSRLGREWASFDTVSDEIVRFQGHCSFTGQSSSTKRTFCCGKNLHDFFFGILANCTDSTARTTFFLSRSLGKRPGDVDVALIQSDLLFLAGVS